MKRTLDQLADQFDDLEKKKRDEYIKKALEHIRPHVLNLENWHVDDFNCVKCKPIVTNEPEKYDWYKDTTYHHAFNLLMTDLNRCHADYRMSYGATSSDITPCIIHSSYPGKQNQPTEKKTRRETAESIFQKTWERLGDVFLEVVQKEAQRWVDFLSDQNNWIPETRKSKPFKLIVEMRYNRYDAQKSIKDYVCRKMTTDTHTLEFVECFSESMVVKIVKKEQVDQK